MADPEFMSPVRDSVFTDRPRISLTDETGVALTRRFGTEIKPGTALRSGPTLSWSVGPGETTAMNGTGGGGVDLTHVRAVFRISGPRAKHTLSKVCGLGLADDMFPHGAATRTSIASVATELIRDDIDGAPSYLLLPSRSFGDYLWNVLVDAAGDGRTTEG